MRCSVAGMLAVVLLAGTPSLCSAITFIDLPGSTGTSANAIDGNNIVGTFGDSTGVHGFLYDGTNFTTLDFPGADSTYANGIQGNMIVGTWWDTVGQHGFVFDGSTYSSVDKPGASHTAITDIDGGNLVGSYRESSGPKHGLLYDGATYATIDPPGSEYTYVWDIDGTTIVGDYEDAATNDVHGYIFDGTSYVTLDHPDTLPYLGNPSYRSYSTVEGVDGDSLVGHFVIFEVSSYQTVAEGGFLSQNGDFTTLRFPGAVAVIPRGIQGTTVVGDLWLDETTPHGFVADISELVAVPEPSTFVIWSSGLLTLLAWRRRR